jgi:pyruvate,orthophosphate dikinase
MNTVYFFGAGQAQGNATMKNELGGKGANLAEMTNIGLPVPAGFTISTSVCMEYVKTGAFSQSLQDDVKKALEKTEKAMGAQFAHAENPLLVSVRSGARVSMPGMMDTVLNLGLTTTTVEALAKKTNNPRFAYDSYRRFIQMYANVVKGLESHAMEDILESFKRKKGFEEDTQLSASDLKELCDAFKTLYRKELGEAFPEDPYSQLWEAIGAVFKSWNCSRAIKYREINQIPHHWGTAVNICSMVYGNMGETSGTGVCFTRDPSTGENVFYGEYLMNAQGEDVVAGIRTPKPLDLLEKESSQVYAELVEVRKKLEAHYKDVQDIEFTIQEGKLYLLQTRNAKRTTQAALKIALDLVKEKILTRSEALMRLAPQDLDKLLHPTLDPKAEKKIIAKGLPASPGAASGRVVLSAMEAEKWASNGEKVILVREETSPEDIGGMYVSQGFLTARGGMTSHAAVVARQMGKCCIAGCSAIHIHMDQKKISIGNSQISEGDWITLDGSTGEVMLGKVPTKEVELGGDFAEFIQWTDDVRRLKVRANADTPKDAALARKFGAQGIGLCRTEHMFFDENRLPYVRQMILAKSQSEIDESLAKLKVFQTEDFVGILSAMESLPVTIRLLDPPLHEFLPQSDEDIAHLATQIKLSPEEIKHRVKSLSESNPMLGHRGCRLGISHPEIYEMQVEAIVEATQKCVQNGKEVFPEIMIPLIGTQEELKWLRARLTKISKDLPFGTMIEVPRAALTADGIAHHADFFSFGTNDLTQTTFGFSRDDSGPFLKAYKQEGILEQDPFASLDQNGVGLLVKMACDLGRKTNATLKLGICGEHGGDPASVHFFHKAGLDYVSCSPFRIPIALLAAAQAALQS